MKKEKTERDLSQTWLKSWLISVNQTKLDPLVALLALPGLTYLEKLKALA